MKNKIDKYYEIKGFLTSIAYTLNEKQEQYILKEILPFLVLMSLDAEYQTRLKGEQ